MNKSGSLGNVMFDAFGREFLKGSDVKNPNYNVEKLNAIKKNLNEYNVLNKYLQDTYGINTQLDHPLSQQTIKKLMNGTAEELSRVNILEQDLNNGFKKTLNDRYLKAVNNNNLVQKRAVEKIAKDLNFNIGSVPDGQFIDVSKIDRGVGSFETLDIKKEMLKSLKNAANLDSEFTKYITANPEVLKDAGINVDTLREPKNVKNIANNIDEIEKYITDTTGKVKQPMVSSGFAGAYEMLSDDLKAITNTEGFKKFSKIAKTPGKFFGIGDFALGYLDYKNNISKGDSKKLATKKALQAMSFGLWKGGDREYLNELKKTYVKNGGDESVFDQVISLNTQNSELMGFVEKTKEQYQRELENEKTFGTAGGPEAIKFKLDVPSASDTLKTNLSAIKNKAENMDKDFTTFTETYKGTDLTKPSKDIKAAAFEDLAAKKRKVFDTQSKQLNTEAGTSGNFLLNNVFTLDPVGKSKEQAYINEMAKNYPQELYRYNLERGVDPDNPVTFDATSNLISKPELGFNFSEGGITSLRSKYEYKK